jgi:uncharacterized membrane protein
MHMDVTGVPLHEDAQRPAGYALKPPNRVQAIDLLRGAVMILMTLDHARDFFSKGGCDPTDLARTNPALFFTRWVTHFCAPVFLFLAGTGAFLSFARGKSRSQLAWFLLSRGSFLVFLECTFVHCTWSFYWDYCPLRCQVIWVIGWSMVVLSGLVFLPTWSVLAVGVCLLFGRNWLDGLLSDFGGGATWLSIFLSTGGTWKPVPGVRLIVVYALLPWLGLMTLGYGLGPLWLLEAGKRRRWLAVIGAAAMLLFLVLRVTNWYGGPRAWSPQSTYLLSLLSFLNVQKYPPSPPYVLMTLGPAILALAWFDGVRGMAAQWLATFGRVPLFYYLIHIPMLHLMAVAYAHGRQTVAGLIIFVAAGRLPVGWVKGLPVVYFFWIGVVVGLYPACRWFAGMKRRHRIAWLSYL